ncbi:MAG TPA: CHASE3 domain-containing protein [Candidatus Acidoferrum sp.]|nr:CHASE3 domain-containing protein [Candidatus Acidoferrum sp.]
MRRVSGRTLWIIFTCAVVVMVSIAVAADLTTARFASSEYWVSHTQRVETRLVELRADLLSAEAARLIYVISTDPEELAAYQESLRQIPQDLDELKTLTFDNPGQQRRVTELRPLIEQRLGVLQESVEMASKGIVNRDQQREYTKMGGDLMRPIRRILDDADADERAVLRQRQTISEETYRWARGVLIMSFFASVLILCAAFAKLLAELRNREQAESAVRSLSARLLKVQDEERRRIARELHDSLGQLLVSIKMNLDHLASLRSAGPLAVDSELVDASLGLVQQSIDETRTLSYLLHPPLLDEFGFASAAKWYIEGFSQRSKIDVNLDVPDSLGRMPEEVELVLFRVLQECLTNIHRHSGSSTAQIHVTRTRDQLFLGVSDHGKGMPPEILDKFRGARASLGVGLAGMRERVHQLGGDLEITSDGAGTVVNVRIPLSGGSPQQEPDSQARARPRAAAKKAKGSKAGESDWNYTAAS